MKYKKFVICLFVLGSSFRVFSEQLCVDENAKTTLGANGLKMIDLLKAKMPSNEFLKVKEKFERGTLPLVEDFKPSYESSFKPVWVGQCYTADGEKQETHVYSSTKNHKGKEYNRVAVRPISEKEINNKNFENFLKSSAHTNANELLKSSSSLVTYHAGIPQFWSGKSTLSVAEMRKVEDGGKTTIIAELKTPFENKSIDNKTEQDRLVDSLPGREAFSYCEFTEQYTKKITRKKNTVGCEGYYSSLHKRFSKAATVKKVLGVAMLPYNFVIAGAMVMDGSSKKKRDAVEEYKIMEQILGEVKASSGPKIPSPALDQLHSFIVSQEPNWGDKDKLLKLLTTANDSFYFCPPNLEKDYSFDLNNVAEEIIKGRLSEDTFID